MSDLRALAEEYVALTGQIEEVRRAMLAFLTNGTDPNPTRPARSSGGSQHPNAKAAKAAEERILELLKTRPMRMAEIAAEMQARPSTTSERLRRLRQRGLAGPVDGGAWAASA